MDAINNKVKRLLVEHGFSDKTKLGNLFIFLKYSSLKDDNEGTSKFMSQAYGLMNKMAEDYQLFLCAAAIEKDIHFSIIRAIEALSKHDSIISMQESYGILGSSIGKKAALFNERVKHDLNNQDSEDADLSCLKALKHYFPGYAYTTNKPSISSTHHVFSSFNSILDRSINSTSHNQNQFIAIYEKSPSTFINQKKVLVRSMALDFMSNNRQHKNILAGKNNVRGRSTRPTYFNANSLLNLAKHDLSWVAPRDIELFEALQRGERTFDELRNFGIDVNELMIRSHEKINDRRLSTKASINYVCSSWRLLGQCNEDVQGMMLKTCSNIFSRLKLTDKGFNYNVIEAAIMTAQSEGLSTIEQFAATIHLHYTGVSHEPIELTEEQDIKAAFEIIKDTAPSVSAEMDAYRHFGISGLKDISVKAANRINKVKRSALSDGLGL